MLSAVLLLGNVEFKKVGDLNCDEINMEINYVW